MVCVLECKPVSLSVSLYVCLCVFEFGHLCVNVCVSFYVYVCHYVCKYVHLSVGQSYFILSISLYESCMYACAHVCVCVLWWIKGRLLTRNSPFCSNSFIFMQFSAKVLPNNRLSHLLWVWHLPSGSGTGVRMSLCVSVWQYLCLYLLVSFVTKKFFYLEDLSLEYYFFEYLFVYFDLSN